LVEESSQGGVEVGVVGRQTRDRLSEIPTSGFQPEGDKCGLELRLVGDSGLALEGLDVGGELLDGGRVTGERDGDGLKVFFFFG